MWERKEKRWGQSEKKRTKSFALFLIIIVYRIAINQLEWHDPVVEKMFNNELAVGRSKARGQIEVDGGGGKNANSFIILAFRYKIRQNTGDNLLLSHPNGVPNHFVVDAAPHSFVHTLKQTSFHFPKKEHESKQPHCGIILMSYGLTLLVFWLNTAADNGVYWHIVFMYAITRRSFSTTRFPPPPPPHHFSQSFYFQLSVVWVTTLCNQWPSRLSHKHSNFHQVYTWNIFTTPTLFFSPILFFFFRNFFSHFETHISFYISNNQIK